jgi:acetolactate synthase regulatory subunit
MPVETIRTAIERASDAYGALAELGETIEEEWSYVTALTEAWLARLDRVVSDRGQEPVPDEVSAAIDRAIAEIGLIADHHRAIDWLSTFPQVVLVALGEAP